MSKLYMSFLGNNYYTPMYYEFNIEEKRKRTETKLNYVQEAYFSLFGEEWNEDDRIIFLLTESAERRNWGDHFFERVQKNNIGLKNKLKDYQLKSKIETKRINVGATEEEIWKNFEIIYDLIHEGDEVVFDITHGFRSLSMSLLTILNYSKVLKSIKLKAIYYGAYEAMYETEGTKEMVEPVFDLSSFETLLDWSIAADSFIKYGQVKDFEKLTEKKLKDRYISGKKGGKTKKLSALKNLLNKTIIPIQTSQCMSILFKSDYSQLRRLIKDNKETFLPTIIPLLDLIEEKFDNFTNNSFDNGFAAVDWCLQHGLIQQGYTILMEVIKSYILCSVDEVELENINEYKPILYDKDEGLYVTNAIRIWQREEKITEEEKGYESDHEKQRTNEMIDFLNENFKKEFGGDFQRLSECRNNINHCGFKDECSNKVFENELKNLNEKFRRWLNVQRN